MLSIVIITKNESAHIGQCLESVKWADEIIVLDSGSDDDTVNQCLQYTDKVYQTDWPGFGIQKQRAVNKAQGQWVMSIDADEMITPDLKLEIVEATRQTEFNAYKIPRLSNFCGQQIHHSGWWPDYTVRLFRRHFGQFTNDPVHETVTVEGKVGRLKNPLLHDTYTDLEEMLDKMNNYSSLSAGMLYQAGRRSSLGKAVLRAFWAFFRTYIIRAGFLDRRYGLMLAISNAENTYYKYLKLLELQNRDNRPV